MKTRNSNPTFQSFNDHLTSVQTRRCFMIKECAFFIAFTLSALLVYYKCKYGFGNIDESFYLVTPLRLYQGDALFAEEWHLSQMSSILLLPFLSAYLRLVGSTTGIILTMRYACTSVQLLTSLLLYYRLRNIHWLGALLASISFLLYTPFGIMALSYNSMGIILLLLASVIYSTSQRCLRLQSMLSGILFSAAVLCCPYLAILYVIYILIIVLMHLQKKHLQNTFCNIQHFVFFSVGIVLSASAFLTFVFSRASIHDVLSALPYIFDDPEHPHISLISKAKEFSHSILYISPVSKPVTYFLFLLFCVCAIDKKRTRRLPFYVIPSILAVMILLYHIYMATPYINFVMWPINLLVPIILLLSSNPNTRRLFLGVYLPGMFYAFCLNLSSNQSFYAISSASSVATVASILILCLSASEWNSSCTPKPLYISSIVCFSLLICSQFFYQIDLRYRSVFWENSIAEQTQYMEDGIYKGLYISKDKEDIYITAIRQMEWLNSFAKPGDHVLFLCETYYYLLNDYRVAAYSGWLSGINLHTLDRLEAYYSLNPDKMPDVVFASQSNDAIAQAFSEQFDYSLYQSDQGIILTKATP